MEKPSQGGFGARASVLLRSPSTLKISLWVPEIWKPVGSWWCSLLSSISPKFRSAEKRHRGRRRWDVWASHTQLRLGGHGGGWGLGCVLCHWRDTIQKSVLNARLFNQSIPLPQLWIKSFHCSTLILDPRTAPPSTGLRCTLFKVCSWGFSLTACHSQLCSPPWHVMGSQCLHTLTTVALIPQTACFRQRKGRWRRLPSSHRESWDRASEVLVLGPGVLGAC